MTEFVIDSEQLERLIEGIEHHTGRKINQVICDGTELPVIVRCRDCTCCFTDELGTYCSLLDFQVADPGEQLDGFCAWGERRKTMDNKNLTPSEQKVANAIGGILAGSAMGCLVGGSVLVVVIVLVALLRLLGWLVGL